MHLLGWARGPIPNAGRTIPTWVRILLTILVTLALGVWGFRKLKFSHPEHLNFIESIYRTLKLYALDLGPAASGSGSPRPNWQLWVALLLAALLVLRALLALARERVRRVATRHFLRGHVIVCGGGVHGSELIRALSGGRPAIGDKKPRAKRDEAKPDVHDVVLVEVDEQAPGMKAPRGRYEWRVVGDSVQEDALLNAGISRANWVVAIAGDDYVNSQIASTVHTLVEKGKAQDCVHVLVQLEDPLLARFLEEDTKLLGRGSEASDAAASDGAGRGEKRRAEKLPVVSPFSANTVAADALLDDARRHDGTPLMEARKGNPPNILLAGDHDLIYALALGAMRRWQEQILLALQPGGEHLQPPEEDAVRPLHISIFGPNAVARADKLQRQWRPERSVAAIEANDAKPGDTDAYGWLEVGRTDHAFVVTEDELAGIELTLGLSRVLGPEVLMTRITTLPGSVLDDHVKVHTARSRRLATTSVEQIWTLASNPQALRRLDPVDRLKQALAREGQDHSEAETLFNRDEVELHSAPSWRIPECERVLLEPLIEPVPLSALVRARLVVDLSALASLRVLGKKLSASDPDGPGFTAWCLFARQANAEQVAEAIAERPGSEIANELLELRKKAIELERKPKRGSEEERADPDQRPRVAILAGGADGMSPATAEATRELLTDALIGYDGTILSGGTGVGLPGVVGEIADKLAIETIGYVPSGRGDGHYSEIRETPDQTEFTVREPLRMWSDILDSGIPPSEVRVLVFPGGSITLREILLARAMGARVAWLDPASEETEALQDQLPLGAAGVFELPVDAMTVRAFLMPSALPRAQRKLREEIARNQHAAYRRHQRRRKPPDDPAMAPWDEMVESLKCSSRATVDDIPNKLALIGKEMRELSRGGKPLELSEEQVDFLGKVEHGRWNVERLFAGWKLGDRDVDRKTSPYLVPWSDLKEDVRDYDRESVRNFGAALEASGWGVVDRAGSRGRRVLRGAPARARLHLSRDRLGKGVGGGGRVDPQAGTGGALGEQQDDTGNDRGGGQSR